MMKAARIIGISVIAVIFGILIGIGIIEFFLFGNLDIVRHAIESYAIFFNVFLFDCIDNGTPIKLDTTLNLLSESLSEFFIQGH